MVVRVLRATLLLLIYTQVVVLQALETILFQLII